jgi:hypothetical protein
MNNYYINETTLNQVAINLYVYTQQMNLMILNAIYNKLAKAGEIK